MSANDNFDPATPTMGSLQPTVQQKKMFRMVGSLLQLLLVALCIEMLLGISDGLGILLRLFLFAVVMTGIVVRIGWLSLIAIQFSLFIQEPRRGQFDQVPSGLFWCIVAMLTIVAAMKLPHVHRALTDTFLRAAGMGGSGKDSQRTRPFAILSLSLHALQLLLAVVLAIVILIKIPIGRQSGRWLQSSIETGQAFWPGTLWLVTIVALFVLARELAWRKIEGSQASLYLRSVRLIANYRDLIRFERERSKQNRNESAKAQIETPQAATRLANKRP